jgi:DNA-binding transcriptional ArsR family regulator
MKDNTKDDTQTKILLTLHNIEDRLQEIADILRVGHRETIEANQRRVLAGSPLRKKIYDLCDGNRSVGQIAKDLGKSIQQVSNNIVILQNSGLVKEVRRGKEKLYVKMR